MARKKTDTKPEWEPDTAPCPYPEDLEFVDLWVGLLETPLWKKKELSTIEGIVKRILKFEPDVNLKHLWLEYLKELVWQSSNRKWEGVIFPDTRTKYEKWKQQKNRLINGAGNPEKNQQFRKDVNSEFASRNY